MFSWGKSKSVAPHTPPVARVGSHESNAGAGLSAADSSSQAPQAPAAPPPAQVGPRPALRLTAVAPAPSPAAEAKPLPASAERPAGNSPVPATTSASTQEQAKPTVFNTVMAVRSAKISTNVVLGVTKRAANLCETGEMQTKFCLLEQTAGHYVLLVAPGVSEDQVQRLIRECNEARIKVGSRHAATTALLATLYSDARGTRKSVDTATINANLSESAAVGEFRSIVNAAAARNASDIEFWPAATAGTHHLMFRIDNQWIKANTYDDHLVENLVRMVYQSRACQPASRSHQDYNKALRQHAIVGIELESGDMQKLRFQSAPPMRGIHANWRLLPRKGALTSQFRTLEDLGLHPSQVYLLSSSVMLDSGLILFIGSTGEGKSTMLDLACSLHPSVGKVKMLAVEDPPEIENANIIKLPVREDDAGAGAEGDTSSWVKALNAALRLAPDIIIVGETRAEEVASLVAQASKTGHLTITTLHGSSPMSAVDRLIEYKLTPAFLFGDDGIKLIVHNKLKRMLCEHCREPVKAGHRYFKELKEMQSVYRLSEEETAHVHSRHAAGCPHCANSPTPGYRSGRIGNSAMFYPDAAVKRAYVTSNKDERDVKALEAFYKQRRARFSDDDMTGKTLCEVILYRVLQGLIPMEDLIEDFGAFIQHQPYFGDSQ